jgi:SH3 domain-containing protein
MFAAFIIWQLRVIYMRGKARTASTARTRFSLAYGINEKPAFVSFADATEDDSPRKSGLLEPAPYDPYARWKPLIRSVTLPSGVTVPPVAVTHPERSLKVHDELPPTPNSGLSLSPLASPPPAYRILGLHTIPIPDPPPESEYASIPPPTPMRRSPGRTISTPVRESFDLPPVPSPSPRSASFKAITDIHAAPTPHRARLASLGSSKSLPRLMAVTTSFDPARHDELRLRAGDTLRLIREFDDEWCLVQRVGLPNAEKGVVPRFCLSERPRLKDYVRFSNSIFHSVRRR